MLLVILGLFGLATGSFVNVVVYRLPRGESVVHPPSHCPSCGTQLAPRDNIPVLSWVVLRARCRTCRAPISIRYPVVELSTAATFVATGAAVGQRWQLVPFLILAMALVAAVGIDLDGFTTPLPVTVGLAVAVVANGAIALAQREGAALVAAAVSGVLAALVVAGALAAATALAARATVTNQGAALGASGGGAGSSTTRASRSGPPVLAGSVAWFAGWGSGWAGGAVAGAFALYAAFVVVEARARPTPTPPPWLWVPVVAGYGAALGAAAAH